LDPGLEAAAADLYRVLEELAVLPWPVRNDHYLAVNWLTIDIAEHCWAMLEAAKTGRWSATSSTYRIIFDRLICVRAAAGSRKFAERWMSSVRDEEPSASPARGKSRARSEDGRDVVAKLRGLTGQARTDFLRIQGELSAQLSALFMHSSPHGPGGSVAANLNPRGVVGALSQFTVVMIMLSAVRDASAAVATLRPGGVPWPQEVLSRAEAAAAAIQAVAADRDWDLTDDMREGMVRALDAPMSVIRRLVEP
jgi:hypothetical protein